MGDEGRVWLTYEDAGKALGIKAASAKRLSFRRHWPHRAGNDGLARVGVPVTELPRVTGDTPRLAPGDDSGTVTGGAPGNGPDASAALALALDRIEALAGQVGHARAEVERLRAELVEAVRERAAAEAAAADARCQAAEAEGAALDAWRTAADLAGHLAAVRPPAAPIRPPPAPPRPRGIMARLLGG